MTEKPKTISQAGEVLISTIDSALNDKNDSITCCDVGFLINLTKHRWDTQFLISEHDVSVNLINDDKYICTGGHDLGRVYCKAVYEMLTGEEWEEADNET